MAERFQLEQPGLKPAIADVQPVVDQTDAIDVAALATGIDTGLDIKDEFTKERLRKQFQDLQDADQGLLDEGAYTTRVANAVREGDENKLAQLQKELDVIGEAERQGLPGSKSALRARSKMLVRRAIDDNPWLASDIRALAATYSVPGFGTSRSTGGDTMGPDEDVQFKADEEIARLAREARHLNLSPKDTMTYVRRGVMDEAQWEMFEGRDKALYLDMSAKVAKNTAGLLENDLEKAFDEAVASGIDFNPSLFKPQVEKAKANTIERIMSRHYQQRQAGVVNYDLDREDVVKMVDEQYDYLNFLLDGRDVKTLRERKRQIDAMTEFDQQAANNYMLGKLFRLFRADENPENLMRAMEQHERLVSTISSFNAPATQWPQIIQRMDPKDRAFWRIVVAGDVRGREDFIAEVEKMTGRDIDNAVAGQIMSDFASFGMSKPGQNQLNDDAARALLGNRSEVQYRAGYTAPEEPPQEIKAQFQSNMHLDMLDQESLVGNMAKRRVVRGSPMSGLTSREVIPYRIRFDEKADKFRLYETDDLGAPTNEIKRGEFLFQGEETELYRTVQNLNEMHKLRKRWGWWKDEEGGRFNSKQGFIEWATGLPTSASTAAATEAGPEAEPEPGTPERPIELEFDEFGNLRERPQPPGPGRAEPLIPGRGTGIMERQIEAGKPDMSTDPQAFRREAVQDLKQDEGLRLSTYRDDAGNPTIGYGHLIEEGDVAMLADLFDMPKESAEEIVAGTRPLTPQMAEVLFEKDVEEHIQKARKLVPKYEGLPNAVKVAILNGVYRGDLSGSPKTLRHINNGDWALAAVEYLNNKEYQRRKERGGDGVTKRMEKNAQVFMEMARA